MKTMPYADDSEFLYWNYFDISIAHDHIFLEVISGAIDQKILILPKHEISPVMINDHASLSSL